MPANKYALLRYRIIDRCLTNSSKPYPSKEELRMACEESLYGSFGEHISASTIEKDIWAMRNEGELGYYAPIEYNKLHKGYFYEDSEYTINDLSLSNEDIEAIRFAANTLFQFKEIPIFQQFDNAIDKIINRLNISPNVNDSGIDEFVQFESSESVSGSEHLEMLLKAIRERFVLRFSYQKFNAPQTKTYVAHPCLLKEYRSRWYLVVQIPGEKRYRTFGLERVQDVEVMSDRFIRDEQFDQSQLFKHSIGITEIDEKPKVTLIRFDKEQAPYIESNPLHSSQKIVARTEKHTDIELYVQETYEFVNAILGYGHHALVLKPDSLRNRIIQENRRVREMYK